MLVGGATAAWPAAARAQQPAGMRRIGMLMGYRESDPAGQSEIAAFRGTLAKLGWTEGTNLRIELRWGAGDADRIRTFAKELVDLRPDVILSQGSGPTSALAGETRTIPIVFVTVGDPTASGLVTTFARPGGNITGFAVDDAAQGGKWVELLKEIAPGTVSVALLWNPATGPSPQRYMPFIQAAASSLAVEVGAAPVHAKDEIEGIIAAQARVPGGGVIVMPASFNTLNRDLIIALAARYKVPAIYTNPFFAESGGLISYGANYAEQFRQVAVYIDRILKGAKPADLPVQVPTRFELLINLKTAKALGLTVSPTLLGRADVVIE
ncbi:MAG TPA: ABC transporter substrate-binding protein [Bradyrhizobium sp.]|nr:ABC transporter substrate-binding protein [Bradyrhizobium sp.]